MIERWLAKLGMVGVLAILLTVSIFVNLYQLRSAGKDDARCATRIAEMVADVDRKTAAREVAALEIGRETKADAEAAVQTITVETTRYVDRIRRETVEVPANCPRALPDGVQDALTDAARAANSFVPAR